MNDRLRQCQRPRGGHLRLVPAPHGPGHTAHARRAPHVTEGVERLLDAAERHAGLGIVNEDSYAELLIAAETVVDAFGPRPARIVLCFPSEFVGVAG